MATQTIKEVTKGNEFKSRTNTVTLPNGTQITRSIDSHGRSVFSQIEAAKICLAFGSSSNANLVIDLRKKGIDVEMYGSNMRFAKNHANKMLRELWTNGGSFVYQPKKGFEQAIRTIFGTSGALKNEYTVTELKKFTDNGILDQMFTKVAKKALQLPTINGYKGTVTGTNIVYGCASLPLAWFATPNGGTRTIESMVLSSGVKISKAQMDAIEAYLKENNISR